MSSEPPLQKPTSSSSPKLASYPKAEAEYQQVVENSDTFFQKLQSFHDFCGSKFRIPTIGGNQLDLHRLFSEVTSRGGIEKVIRDRRWKEITGAFNFPSSITNASFVLRKYYMSLLYHFEQVYYLRKEQPHFSAADHQTSTIEEGPTSHHSVSQEPPSNQLAVNGKIEDGCVIEGTIDGKFESGYIITVKVGSDDFKGVLYHSATEPNEPQGFRSSPHEFLKARRKHLLRDPSRPKRNRSGYTFFFAEQYHQLRPLYLGQERAISKRIGHLWSSLSEPEKLVYQQKGLVDKERYKAEMMEYKSSHHVES